LSPKEFQASDDRQLIDALKVVSQLAAHESITSVQNRTTR